MNRDDKNQAVATLRDDIGSATNAFLIEFKGITVPQVTELRRQIRESNSSYVVVKNTLALIALKDSPMLEMREQFSGPTAVAYGKDAVILAKTLTRFAKDVPALIFKGALLDGRVVPATQIQTIASLPTREELISKLLFLLQTPIRNLVTVLSANQRNLAVVLDQIAKQKEPDAEAKGPDSGSEKPAAISEPAEAPVATAPEVENSVPAADAPEASAPESENREPAEVAGGSTPEAENSATVENTSPSENPTSSENDSNQSENDSNQSENEPIGG